LVALACLNGYNPLFVNTKLVEMVVFEWVPVTGYQFAPREIRVAGYKFQVTGKTNHSAFA